MSLVARDIRSAGIEAAELTVPPGACVAVMGPSGAGKTRLLRALADLDPHTGEVMLDGRPRAAISAPAWRKAVAYVPAETGWWVDRVGAHFRNEAEAAPWLERLGLPGDALSWPVSRLSSGERQRLGLIRALLMTPEALLLDEPTAALDAAAKRAVEKSLKSFLKGGGMIVLATHDAPQAKRLAGDIRRIADGHMLAAGKSGAAS